MQAIALGWQSVPGLRSGAARFEYAAALVAFALALFVPSLLNDGDTYWHLATGELILRRHAVPSVDGFSFTAAGQAWHAHEWLAEAIMAAAYRLDDWTGVVVLCAAAFAASVGIVAQAFGRVLPWRAAAAAVALSANCIGPSLLARPHLLALPLLAWWTVALLSARERGPAPSRLAPAMIVWANLHGSFALGLALLAAFAAEACWANRSGRAWLGCLAACTLAACVTPWGPAGLEFPVSLLRMQQLTHVTEWGPPDFSTLQPIELAVLAVLAVALRGGLRLSPLRTGILLAVIHMALGHGRHQMVAGVVGGLMLAVPLGRCFPEAKHAGRRRAATAPIAFACAAGLLALRLAAPIVRGDDAVSPVAAVAHVPAELRDRPVLNDYQFGGYLIWAGVRPFVDGRADLYGDGFLRDYGAMTRPDRAAFEREAARWNARWTIFPAGSPMASMLDGMPGWRRSYADEIAVVHVRSD